MSHLIVFYIYLTLAHTSYIIFIAMQFHNDYFIHQETIRLSRSKGNLIKKQRDQT